MRYPKRLFGTPLKLFNPTAPLKEYVDDNIDNSINISYVVYESGSCGIEVRYDIKFCVGAEIITRRATLYVYRCSERAARKAIRIAINDTITKVYNVT